MSATSADSDISNGPQQIHIDKDTARRMTGSGLEPLRSYKERQDTFEQWARVKFRKQNESYEQLIEQREALTRSFEVKHGSLATRVRLLEDPQRLSPLTAYLKALERRVEDRFAALEAQATSKAAEVDTAILLLSDQVRSIQGAVIRDQERLGRLEESLGFQSVDNTLDDRQPGPNESTSQWKAATEDSRMLEPACNGARLRSAISAQQEKLYTLETTLPELEHKVRQDVLNTERSLERHQKTRVYGLGQQLRQHLGLTCGRLSRMTASDCDPADSETERLHITTDVSSSTDDHASVRAESTYEKSAYSTTPSTIRPQPLISSEPASAPESTMVPVRRAASNLADSHVLRRANSSPSSPLDSMSSFTGNDAAKLDASSELVAAKRPPPPQWSKAIADARRTPRVQQKKRKFDAFVPSKDVTVDRTQVGTESRAKRRSVTVK